MRNEIQLNTALDLTQKYDCKILTFNFNLVANICLSY